MRALGLLFAVPIVLAAGAIYILVATPDVVTQTVEYTHSHTDAALVGLLAVLSFLIAVVAGAFDR